MHPDVSILFPMACGHSRHTAQVLCMDIYTYNPWFLSGLVSNVHIFHSHVLLHLSLPYVPVIVRPPTPHDTPVTGHLEWWKMTELVAHDYWWCQSLSLPSHPPPNTLLAGHGPCLILFMGSCIFYFYIQISLYLPF